jgi:hypothetical protein
LTLGSIRAIATASVGWPLTLNHARLGFGRAATEHGLEGARSVVVRLRETVAGR